MKKGVSTIRKAVIFALAAFLAGCINPTEFTSSPPSPGESSTESAVRFPDYVYDQEASQDSYGTRAAVQEKGYYLLANSILYFHDVQSDLLFPLCTKESCRHKDETCNAYIGEQISQIDDGKGNVVVEYGAEEAAGDMIWYYRDHLYMVAYDPDAGYALMQYGPEFTEQKIITWLSDFEAEPWNMLNITWTDLGTILFHGGYAYYLTYEWDVEKAKATPEYETVYTAWRVRLEEKAEAEELFSFEDRWCGSQAYRIGALQDDIYFVIGHLKNHYIPEDEQKDGETAWTTTGSRRLIYRYNENDGAELIWSYDGADIVSPFEAEGAMPRNTWSRDYLITREGDYVYFTGEAEKLSIYSTGIAVVNLATKKGRMLYETPYDWIEQLRSDGSHYYFIEVGKSKTFLTAIDKEGNLLRRYELPYCEEFFERMERSKIPEEEWGWSGSENLSFLAADGRYIVLEGFAYNSFQGLTSHANGGPLTGRVDEGIGVINIEDFLSGKDVEIRQIYERTDPFR